MLTSVALAANANEQGQYLARIGGCIGCHSVEGQTPLAGGKAFKTPFGIFYSSNITPSLEHGIGRWSMEDFSRAMTQGIAPDGRAYYPVFPYRHFAGLSDQDLAALKTYLDQQPVSDQRNKDHQPNLMLRAEFLLQWWQVLYPPPARDATPSRGQYLVDHLMHCGACHTARDPLGGFRDNAALRGATLASGNPAPNLTPHEQGLLLWEPETVVEYLRTGKSEWGQNARDEMREYIDTSSQYLNDADANAIAEYLLSLPPASDFRACIKHGPRMHFCR